MHNGNITKWILCQIFVTQIWVQIGIQLSLLSWKKRQPLWTLLILKGNKLIYLYMCTHRDTDTSNLCMKWRFGFNSVLWNRKTKPTPNQREKKRKSTKKQTREKSNYVFHTQKKNFSILQNFTSNKTQYTSVNFVVIM